MESRLPLVGRGVTLADVAHEQLVELPWWKRLLVQRRHRVRYVVTFPELAREHLRWLQALDGDDADELTRAKARFGAALARFEAEHGRIVDAYWCSHKASAVALTERRLVFALRGRRSLRFHRATDWATQSNNAVSDQLHRCDDIAIRAGSVLTGVRERICVELVMTTAKHILSLVDPKAAHEPEATEIALAEETKQLDRAESYYDDAANGQAQMIYFLGMAVFAAALGVLSLLGSFAGLDKEEFWGSLFAGGVGAVVSVIQRINSGRFDTEYDVGRLYPFFLGGLRPLLGGVFGLGVYLAATSELLNVLPADNADARLPGLLVFAFVAGFSERWAKDTLAVATGGVAPREPANGSKS
jgi:hypothetical protein